QWATDTNGALEGLALLLLIRQFLPEPSTAPRGWTRIGLCRSQHQPGLLRLAQQLDEHLADAPTVAATMEWLVARSIVAAHEAIAYGKLPEFTFRVRWESGRLVFFDNGTGRFGLPGSRRGAMLQITEDIGFWERVDGRAALSAEGARFVEDVLR